MEIDGREPATPGTVGPEPRWNESMYVFLRDPATAVSVWVRIAQQPNLGATSTFACVALPDGRRFRHFDIGGFEPGQRGEGWRGNGMEFRNVGSELEVRYSSVDCDIDIAWTGFHHPVDFHRIMASFSDDLGEINAEHVEQSGRATGRIRVGDDDSSIDALGFRDHSWGHRDTANMLTHRWMIGTTGPELSWSGVAVLMADGNLVKTGWVVRDGELTPAKDMDVTLATLEDGLSYTQADATMHLMDGSDLDLTLTDVVVGGVLEIPPGAVVIECSGVATANGGIGVGNCEVSNSITGGTAAPPVLVTGGAVGQGITP